MIFKSINHIADFKWASYGKDGKGPKQENLLINLETDHLMAILKNCPHIKNTHYELAIRTLLEC